MKHLLFIIPFVLLIAGCETYYWPRDYSGGYEEKRLEDGTWEVRMSVPDTKRLSYAEDLCLLRCAELSLDSGAIGFVVEGTDEKKETERGSGLEIAFPRKNDTDSGVPSVHSVADIRITQTYMMKIRMISSSDAIPDGNNVYDSQTVLGQMKKKYRLGRVLDYKSRRNIDF